MALLVRKKQQGNPFPLFFAGTQEPYLDHINCNWQPDSLEPSYTLLGWCQPSGSRNHYPNGLKREIGDTYQTVRTCLYRHE